MHRHPQLREYFEAKARAGYLLIKPGSALENFVRRHGGISPQKDTIAVSAHIGVKMQKTPTYMPIDKRAPAR